MEAQFYQKLPGSDVQCLLCPRRCLIKEGKSGFCRVRVNRNGILLAASYARPAALQIDPIEKKPLSFFRPGSRTFSVGTFGCNLGCRFCQNDSLSRSGMEHGKELPEILPEPIAALAKKNDCESVALTYNEPTVFFEYALEIAIRAHEAGLDTVLVSNGYILPEPRKRLYPLIDAANIDVKGFGRFYPTFCAGELEPVLESCRYFHELGGHLELTNLLIPGCNDSEEQLKQLLDWILRDLGTEVPLHFSAYFPAGGFSVPPTPPETLYRARDLALRRGIRHVILGNL